MLRWVNIRWSNRVAAVPMGVSKDTGKKEIINARFEADTADLVESLLYDGA